MQYTNPFMKNFLFAILFLSLTSLSAQTKKLNLDAKIAANYSDLNYGSEFVASFLNNPDYNALFTSGDSDFGLQLGLGLSYELSSKSKIRGALNYHRYNYKIDGQLVDLKTTVNRPLDASIAVSVDGKVNYSFLGLEVAYLYSFKKQDTDGFFISPSISYLLNLKTDWNVDVRSETASTSEHKDLKQVVDPDINNLLIGQLELGYTVLLNRYSISPSVAMAYGMNAVHDDALNPTVFTLGLRFSRL